MRLKPLAAILAVIFAVLLCGCSRTATSTSSKDDSASSKHDAKQHNKQPKDQIDTRQVSDTESHILSSDHPIYKRWPQPIETAVMSPDGKAIAVYDSKGIFLTDAKSKHVRKVPITLSQKLANEEVNVAFAFRPDSKRIAVLTTLNYGEPMGAFIERLWTADVTTGKPRRLSEWEDRIQGSSPVTADRQIEGWTKDGKSIIVVGTVYGGEEMPIDAQKIGTQRAVIKDLPAPEKPYMSADKHWQERNGKMAENLRDICAQYQGQRVVATMGCDHRYILRRLLQMPRQYISRNTGKLWTYKLS